MQPDLESLYALVFAEHQHRLSDDQVLTLYAQRGRSPLARLNLLAGQLAVYDAHSQSLDAAWRALGKPTVAPRYRRLRYMAAPADRRAA